MNSNNEKFSKICLVFCVFFLIENTIVERFIPIILCCLDVKWLDTCYWKNKFEKKKNKSNFHTKNSLKLHKPCRKYEHPRNVQHMSFANCPILCRLNMRIPNRLNSKNEIAEIQWYLLLLLIWRTMITIVKYIREFN